MPKDRKALVIESTTFNGIDFVEVVGGGTDLRVHFLNSVALNGDLSDLSVTITNGETIPQVPVNDDLSWSYDGDHLVLSFSVAEPGDFSNYTLEITSSAPDSGLDPYFSTSVFTFQSGTPPGLDCRKSKAVCPPPVSDAPPIDYTAKDFLSFRQALLDFSATVYPNWQERSEADFGIMFMEALCSVADDLSYTQDRIAAESTLETATQRRSLVRQAHLVDYWPAPACSATVTLQFDVEPATTWLANGTLVTARAPDGTIVPFETGPSLTKRGNTTTAVKSAWNSGIMPYWFDDSRRCLPAGSTQMYILGRNYGFTQGQQLLIDTTPQNSADPPIRQIVTLVSVIELCDPLYDPDPSLPPRYPVKYCCGATPDSGTAVTQLTWDIADALTDERDLTCTTLAGNLISATQGMTQPIEQFIVPDDLAQTSGILPGGLLPAIVRTGPNNTFSDPSLQYLYTLQQAPLAWLHPTVSTKPPEILLVQVDAAGNQTPWKYLRWLLDAQPLESAFTIDAVKYSLMSGGLDSVPQYEYDGDGDTIRFGDGTFGAAPPGGTQFSVQYRVGGGSIGNVAADTITGLSPTTTGVVSVTNPQPAKGGADPELLDHIRQFAPEAFRAVQYRAVLAEDYQAAAETLPWVLRAGSVFRWTGSWTTVFTTPEPINTERVSLKNRLELIKLLNRYRMAGYESYVPNPNYLSIDLIVTVSALSTAFQGYVEQGVLTALGTAPGEFFNHKNFTFGQALQLSVLEAAIQRVNGVAGVDLIQYQISGLTSGFVEMPDTVKVGTDQIIRCDNDPSLPGHGTLKVVIQGGR
jgi:hypothetical protein